MVSLALITYIVGLRTGLRLSQRLKVRSSRLAPSAATRSIGFYTAGPLRQNYDYWFVDHGQPKG